MSKKWLGIGDKVKVQFGNEICISGEIVGTIFEEGQAFPEYSIKDDNGKLHTVQHFFMMSELEIKTPNNEYMQLCKTCIYRKTCESVGKQCCDYKEA